MQSGSCFMQRQSTYFGSRYIHFILLYDPADYELSRVYVFGHFLYHTKPNLGIFEARIRRRETETISSFADVKIY